MIKQKELNSADSCLNKAAMDEPIFVLRANDPCAAATIRHWAVLSQGIHEPEKLTEARSLANSFEDWRKNKLSST